MTTPIIVTRGWRGHTPGTHLDLPDGVAASMIAAGLARRPPAPTPNQNPPHQPQPTPHNTLPGQTETATPNQTPPRAGPGSTRQSWANHATNLGVPVHETMTRDEIISAVDHATEPETVPSDE